MNYIVPMICGIDFYETQANKRDTLEINIDFIQKCTNYNLFI